MNPNCKCGGRLRRTDIIPSAPVNYGGRMYPTTTDASSKIAEWRCDKCGIRRTQRKRQPGQQKCGRCNGTGKFHRIGEPKPEACGMCSGRGHIIVKKLEKRNAPTM